MHKRKNFHNKKQRPSVADQSDEQVIWEYLAYDYMIYEAQCYSVKDMQWHMAYSEEIAKRWIEDRVEKARTKITTWKF